MISIWQDNISLPHFPKLEEDIHTDVLIIGGGMAGLLTAYFLHQEGVSYTLVEGRTICSGVTGNTTAKITAQHGLIYHKLIQSFGVEQAQGYLQLNLDALAKFRELCETIPCDFEEKDAYVYSLDNRQIIEQEISAVQKLGFQSDFRDTLSLPFSVVGAIRFPHQAQFHPLRFAGTLANGLHIYENTWVNKIQGHTAITDQGNITADKIIIATHFPFLRSGTYFLRMYQHRSYVIALENGEDINGMYVDEVQNGMSFRNYKNMLLIGGGDHKNGKQGGNWKELEQFAGRYYPRSPEKYRYAAQDCITLDSIPYIGTYSKRKPDYLTATGFQKWGMSSSMAAAMLLTDEIMNRPNKYASIFSPSRSLFKPQLLINGAGAVKNLLTPSLKRCPHMGCALKWNPAERTWDCPCHGSRFDRNGTVLDNPANTDLD